MKRIDGNETGVSIETYRKILNDYESTDERIRERLEYLNSFCRNVIRQELEKHLKTGK